MSAINPIRGEQPLTTHVPNPNSNSSTNVEEIADRGLPGVPYCTSIDITWSKKGSTEEIKSTFSVKVSDYTLAQSDKNGAILLSKRPNYTLKIQKIFDSISGIFSQNENNSTHPVEYKIHDSIDNQNDTIVLSFKKNHFKFNENNEPRIALYIEGKNSQGEPFLVRSNGKFFLLSFFTSPRSQRMIHKILEKESHADFALGWPELGSSKASVSNESSMATPQPLNRHFSFESVKTNLKKAINGFLINRQDQAAKHSTGISDGLSATELNHEMLPVMSSPAELGQEYVQSTENSDPDQVFLEWTHSENPIQKESIVFTKVREGKLKSAFNQDEKGHVLLSKYRRNYKLVLNNDTKKVFDFRNAFSFHISTPDGKTTENLIEKVMFVKPDEFSFSLKGCLLASGRGHKHFNLVLQQDKTKLCSPLIQLFGRRKQTDEGFHCGYGDSGSRNLRSKKRSKTQHISVPNIDLENELSFPVNSTSVRGIFDVENFDDTPDLLPLDRLIQPLSFPPESDSSSTSLQPVVNQPVSSSEDATPYQALLEWTHSENPMQKESVVFAQFAGTRTPPLIWDEKGHMLLMKMRRNYKLVLNKDSKKAFDFCKAFTFRISTLDEKKTEDLLEKVTYRKSDVLGFSFKKCVLTSGQEQEHFKLILQQDKTKLCSPHIRLQLQSQRYINRIVPCNYRDEDSQNPSSEERSISSSENESPSPSPLVNSTSVGQELLLEDPDLTSDLLSLDQPCSDDEIIEAAVLSYFDPFELGAFEQMPSDLQ